MRLWVEFVCVALFALFVLLIYYLCITCVLFVCYLCVVCVICVMWFCCEEGRYNFRKGDGDGVEEADVDAGAEGILHNSCLKKPGALTRKSGVKSSLE